MKREGGGVKNDRSGNVFKIFENMLDKKYDRIRRYRIIKKHIPRQT